MRVKATTMAERKDIQFAYGIRRSPSIADEGELSECVNLIPYGGELVNIQPPKDTGVALPEGHVLACVHVNSSYRHYITRKGNGIYWVEYPDGSGAATDAAVHPIAELTGELKGINVLGNTLYIFTGNESYYAVYKAGSYSLLNQKPVFPSISFRLKGERRAISTDAVTFPQVWSYVAMDGLLSVTPPENAPLIRNEIFSKLNPVVSELRQAKYFIYPFFVRYAYKLYDGSVSMASSPVKMLTGYPSPAEFGGVNGKMPGVDEGSSNFNIGLLYCSLWYQITNSDELKKDLEDWKDLIQGIEIYITPALTCLDQEKSFDYSINKQYGTVTTNGFDQYSVGYTRADCLFPGTVYRRFDTAKNRGTDTLLGDFTANGGHPYVIPRYNVLYEDDGVLPFYKILSIGIDEIGGDETRVMPDDGVLDSDETLAAQERLTAEGQPDGTFLPECTFVYNGRLHLANLRIMPPSYPLEHLFAYRNGYLGTGKEEAKAYKFTGYALLHNDSDHDVAVQLPCYLETYLPEGLFVYYPDPNAYKMVLVAEDGDGNKLYSSTTLTEHKGLDGSFGYVEAFTQTDNGALDGIGEMGDALEYTNKMYVSDANNPFSFQLDGVVTVGTGQIKGIVSATKALSQGQFGEFPLYVFCTDGIWSLQVGSSGLYSASHPVSRDVCNNPGSITQIDSAIVFSTDRGLKLLQGSDVTLLSEPMDGHNTDESAFNVDNAYSALLVPDTDAFTSMLASCRICYDYAHGLLRIFPGNTDGKHYVYSLSSGEYSTYVGFTPDALVADYPGILAQSGQELYSFDRYVSGELRKGLLVTRPVSFGDPFGYKMLEGLRMAYYRATGKSRYRIAVFGSYDNVKYYRVDSLRQSSFKYYRFVCYTEMSDDDTLSGFSAMVEYRGLGKLR